jgi:hypothetical protein
MFVAKASNYRNINFNNSHFTCNINFSDTPSIKAGEYALRVLFGMPTSKSKLINVPLSQFDNTDITRSGLEDISYIGNVDIYLLKERDRQATIETYSSGYGSRGSINVVDHHYPKKIVVKKGNVEKTYEDLRVLFPSVPLKKTSTNLIKFRRK